MLVQVFYHLGELDEALSYALGAGKLFDINEPSEYVQTTLGEPSTHAGKPMVDVRFSSTIMQCFAEAHTVLFYAQISA